ncbi:MAG: hypothetical protein WKF65_09780 [Gaiellaceae bacterium]
MADEPTSPADPLAKAADRIRETAKWLITIFTAVGGVLVAGSQLSDIGDLSFGRFVLALLAVFIGLAGVAFAVNQAASVMTASRVSLGDLAEGSGDEMQNLRTRVNSDPALLVGYANVGALKQEYVDRHEKQKETYDAYYADVDSDIKYRAAELADARVAAVEQSVDRLMAAASFERLGKAFDDARKKMFWGALVAAAGIVTFAAVAHWDSAEEEPLKIDIPAEVRLSITDQGRKLLAGRNGGKCTARTLRAVVVAVDGEKADVVTMPAGGCRTARFKVPGKIGDLADE